MHLVMIVRAHRRPLVAAAREVALLASVLAACLPPQATPLAPSPAPPPVTAAASAPPRPGPASDFDGLCHRGEIEPCLQSAGAALSGGTESEAHRAAALLDFHCQDAYPSACVILALGLLDQQPVARAAAGRSLERGCALDPIPSCALLAALVETGTPEPDPLYGAALSELSCLAGHHPACEAMARTLLASPNLPSVDVETLVTTLDADCSAGAASACELAGHLYLEVTDAPNAPAEGRARLEAACRLGLDRACTTTARPAPLPAGDPMALVRATLPPLRADRIATRVDPQATRLRLEEICQADSLAACLILAAADDTPRRQARELIAAACNLAHLPSCAELGVWLMEGDGVTTDRARGKHLLREACAGNVRRACDALDRYRISP
ncbi:MAG: hypothetical protein HY903_07390 [Deltaproteobacteria bacterium]|nr:hypothetical protein [Deltaproteobacteria bacterium]